MLHAGLPKKLWGECVMTATYLINKMPMKVLGWKSPFEILYGNAPSYDHLRVMGCLCFASIQGKGRDKFDSRGRKCIMLGYALNQKGYRLLDLETDEIFTSRDVRFFEHEFPFKGKNKDMIHMEQDVLIPENIVDMGDPEILDEA